MAADCSIRQTAIVGLALLSAACSQTTYVDKDVGRHGADALNLFDRVVEYQYDLGLMASRPSCIAVGSVEVAENLSHSQRMVDVVHSALLFRAQAVLRGVTIVEIPSDPESAVFEASILGCLHILFAELIVQDESYLLLWSRKRIGIRARLVRADDREELWTARHIASRSEGDVPLNPLGAAITVFRTKDFADDKDVFPSMVDDAVRRIFETFPVNGQTVVQRL
jgi:hypothetical protein